MRIMDKQLDKIMRILKKKTRCSYCGDKSGKLVLYDEDEESGKLVYLCKPCYQSENERFKKRIANARELFRDSKPKKIIRKIKSWFLGKNGGG